MKKISDVIVKFPGRTSAESTSSTWRPPQIPRISSQNVLLSTLASCDGIVRWRICLERREGKGTKGRVWGRHLFTCQEREGKREGIESGEQRVYDFGVQQHAWCYLQNFMVWSKISVCFYSVLVVLLVWSVFTWTTQIFFKGKAMQIFSRQLWRRQCKYFFLLFFFV